MCTLTKKYTNYLGSTHVLAPTPVGITQINLSPLYVSEKLHVVGREGAVHIKTCAPLPLTVGAAKMLAMTLSSAFAPPKVRVPSASSMATASMLATPGEEITPSATRVAIASNNEVALTEVIPREDKDVTESGVVP